IRKNFLADGGRFGAGPGQDHIELSVPPLANFVIVVSAPPLGNTVGTGLGFDPYFDILVAGCGDTAAAPAPPPSSGADADAGGSVAPPTNATPPATPSAKSNTEGA